MAHGTTPTDPIRLAADPTFGPDASTGVMPLRVVHNQAYFYPRTAEVGFYVRFHDNPDLGEPAGVYMSVPGMGQWQLIQRLDDVPVGEWVQLSDHAGRPLPFSLRRHEGPTADAVWLPIA